MSPSLGSKSWLLSFQTLGAPLASAAIGDRDSLSPIISAGTSQMTTKHLSGRYPGGYTLAYGYSRLVIGRSGYIGGDGLTVPFSASVVNGGVVHGGRQGVFLEGGGSLVNGAAQNTRATITGQQDGVTAFYATAVANFGTIRSSGSNGAGVFVGDAASVTNGSAADSAALISGYYGVESNGGPATVVNFGTIEGAKYGVSIDNGGKVTNGSAADTRASIFGVAIGAADATVTNFGTIAGAATARCGVDLQTGGVVTNGSATDVAAIISGSSCGVYGYALTLANFGTIEAASSARSGAGLAASGRGSLTNGSAADTSALIQGYDGCDIGRLTTLTNNGTIEGAAHGVYLNAYSPSLINGSDQNRTALITGNVGLESWFSSQGRLVNYGTIRGSAWGVRLGASATLTNGSATDHTALIEAAAGFYARENFGYVTLDNFGIVEGTSGLAVGLSGGPNEVIAEAGSTFIGSVQGGGGRGWSGNHQRAWRTCDDHGRGRRRHQRFRLL
jgi:fibronectin-binding autotransporter adhesin